MDNGITIDELKAQLKKTGNQKKRRKLLDGYTHEDFDENDKIRYQSLCEKARQPVSVIKKCLILGLALYIPSWIMTFVIAFGTDILRSNEITGIKDIVIMLAGLIFSVWALAGPIIEIILLIVLLKIRKSDKYYLNIKNI